MPRLGRHHKHHNPPPPPPTPGPTGGTTQTGVYITLYGWPDNDPPGGAIAYPDIHQTAGGTGTYADPITFASDIREIPAGTRIYIPVYQKYFIMEDECVAAEQDWSKSGSGTLTSGLAVRVSTEPPCSRRRTR